MKTFKTKKQTPPSRGSEWRKWDLHIHTPMSIRQQYGGNTDEVWEKFISDLENLPQEFKVIGINDYIFLDGYTKVLEFKKNGRLENIDLILPVVELRIDKFGSIGDEAWKKVNFHIIFSNDVDALTIEQQFLNAIQHSHKLSPDYESLDFSGVITRESLSDFGQKIKDSSNGKVTGSNIVVGFNNITYGYKEILERLTSTYFKDSYLTAIGKTEWEALRWDASIADKKNVINRADLVFISSKSIEGFDKAKAKLKEQSVNDKLIDCSDAHHFSFSIDSCEKPIKDRLGKCFTWIKADPTFEGLKQIIFEPLDRVYIGDQPEIFERVKNNKNKYIDRLSINQKSEYNGKQGIWFKNIDIPFNNELVAIIGNKGSGKSALTDIIGLLGNTHNAGEKNKNLTFLKSPKFRKRGFAENFEAKLIWADNKDEGSTSLNQDLDLNQKEKVKYLPQHYFESLTNDIDSGNFEKTLKDVTFLHISEEEKLGCSSFDELEKIKKKSIEADLTELKNELSEISDEIILLEYKKHPNNLKRLNNLLLEKQKEYKGHLALKPQKVKDPAKDEKAGKEKKVLYQKLESLNSKLEKISKSIDESREQLNLLTLEKEDLNVFYNDLIRFEKNISDYKQKKRKAYQKYGFDIDLIIKTTFNHQEIKKKIGQIELKTSVLNNKLRTKDEIDLKFFSKEEETKKALQDSLEVKRDSIQTQINKNKKDLTKPEREFQEYNENLQSWELKRKSIEGAPDTPDTILFFEKEISYIRKTINKDINDLREERLEKALEIFHKKMEIVELYNSFKKSIDSKISSDKDFHKRYLMEIEAGFKVSPKFATDFLGFINKSKSGTFRGAEEKDIVSLFEELNLLEGDEIKKILSKIIFILENDQRLEIREEDQKHQISDQISNIKGFYDFLFSLEYLIPKYELKLDQKTLEELSPGEKGALLLVFYLMIDKEDTPLIVDQPEDNLDNKSVFQVLTHFIKEAKKRRQIIIVTHNPNLAVGADAEQIVFVELDKTNKYKFSFESGSIENPTINNKIVDILEGTMPAFDKRKLKYMEIENN